MPKKKQHKKKKAPQKVMSEKKSRDTANRARASNASGLCACYSGCLGHLEIVVADCAFSVDYPVGGLRAIGDSSFLLPDEKRHRR